MAGLLHSCCDPCNEFCSGFELNLNFQKDTAQAGYFAQSEIDSAWVIRQHSTLLTDSARLPFSGQFRFNTNTDPQGFRFLFLLPADTFIVENIQTEKKKSDCCKCGDLTGITYQLNGQPVRVSRGESRTISK